MKTENTQADTATTTAKMKIIRVEAIRLCLITSFKSNANIDRLFIYFK